MHIKRLPAARQPSLKASSIIRHTGSGSIGYAFSAGSQWCTGHLHVRMWRTPVNEGLDLGTAASARPQHRRSVSISHGPRRRLWAETSDNPNELARQSGPAGTCVSELGREHPANQHCSTLALDEQGNCRRQLRSAPPFGPLQQRRLARALAA